MSKISEELVNLSNRATAGRTSKRNIKLPSYAIEKNTHVEPKIIDNIIPIDSLKVKNNLSKKPKRTLCLNLGNNNTSAEEINNESVEVINEPSISDVVAIPVVEFSGVEETPAVSKIVSDDTVTIDEFSLSTVPVVEDITPVAENIVENITPVIENAITENIVTENVVENPIPTIESILGTITPVEEPTPVDEKPVINLGSPFFYTPSVFKQYSIEISDANGVDEDVHAEANRILEESLIASRNKEISEKIIPQQEITINALPHKAEIVQENKIPKTKNKSKAKSTSKEATQKIKVAQKEVDSKNKIVTKKVAHKTKIAAKDITPASKIKTAKPVAKKVATKNATVTKKAVVSKDKVVAKKDVVSKDKTLVKKATPKKGAIATKPVVKTIDSKNKKVTKTVAPKSKVATKAVTSTKKVKTTKPVSKKVASRDKVVATKAVVSKDKTPVKKATAKKEAISSKPAVKAVAQKSKKVATKKAVTPASKVAKVVAKQVIANNKSTSQNVISKKELLALIKSQIEAKNIEESIKRSIAKKAIIASKQTASNVNKAPNKIAISAKPQNDITTKPVSVDLDALISYDTPVKTNAVDLDALISQDTINEAYFKTINIEEPVIEEAIAPVNPVAMEPIVKEVASPIEPVIKETANPVGILVEPTKPKIQEKINTHRTSSFNSIFKKFSYDEAELVTSANGVVDETPAITNINTISEVQKTIESAKIGQEKNVTELNVQANPVATIPVIENDVDVITAIDPSNNYMPENDIAPLNVLTPNSNSDDTNFSIENYFGLGNDISESEENIEETFSYDDLVGEDLLDDNADIEFDTEELYDEDEEKIINEIIKELDEEFVFEDHQNYELADKSDDIIIEDNNIEIVEDSIFDSLIDDISLDDIDLEDLSSLTIKDVISNKEIIENNDSDYFDEADIELEDLLDSNIEIEDILEENADAEEYLDIEGEFDTEEPKEESINAEEIIDVDDEDYDSDEYFDLSQIDELEDFIEESIEKLIEDKSELETDINFDDIYNEILELDDFEEENVESNDVNEDDIEIEDILDNIDKNDIEIDEEDIEFDSLGDVEKDISDITESEIETILSDAISSDENIKEKLLTELFGDSISLDIDGANKEVSSDFLKVINTLTQTISKLEHKNQQQNQLIDESGKAFNIAIDKDDIFSISILNETYEIVADFDGISVLSENIHISTPKNNFFVQIGEKYIEIHNQKTNFVVYTSFEDVEFANALNNVGFTKKDNRIELTIKEAFKLSSIDNKVTLSMLNTSIADIEGSQSTSGEDEEGSVCDNKTLVISEETQKVYLPYTIKDIMEKLNDTSTGYQTVQDVIDEEYIVPLAEFKMPVISRFKEAYRFMREKEHSSVYAAIDLALELMFNSNLNPAIIRASKNLRELNIYLDCLYENELEKFDCFKVIYKVLPKIQ